MVVIFDLDDTLYDEITFVKSGFNAVASFINKLTGTFQSAIFSRMMEILAEQGRGKVFNVILKENNIFSKKNVIKCVSLYRLHYPQIKITTETELLLNRFSNNYPLYVVTDGNKIVQGHKVEALGISKYFRKVYVTHRYGLKASKPSLICFEKIKTQEKVNWNQMLYIGDNPKKDFVSLNKAGAHTIRIVQGDHKNVKLNTEYEAQQNIMHLNELKEIIPSLSNSYIP